MHFFQYLVPAWSAWCPFCLRAPFPIWDPRQSCDYIPPTTTCWRRGSDAIGLICNVVCRARTFSPEHLLLSNLLFCPVKFFDARISFCLLIFGVYPEQQIWGSIHILCGYYRAACTVFSGKKIIAFQLSQTHWSLTGFDSPDNWLGNSYICTLCVKVYFLTSHWEAIAAPSIII